jgi:hypothetical protein
MSIIRISKPLVVLALGLAATNAWAAPPKTDPVIASLGLTLISEPTTYTCTGVDGNYTELKDTFSGPIVSTDPRLNGTLTVNADILVNTTTGFGAGSGTWSVRNLLGQVLVTGSFKGAVSDFVLFKGTAWGEATGGGKFFGNISVIVAGNAAVGSIGSPLPTVPTEPAVFQVGSCVGSGP